MTGLLNPEFQNEMGVLSSNAYVYMELDRHKSASLEVYVRHCMHFIGVLKLAEDSAVASRGHLLRREELPLKNFRAGNAVFSSQKLVLANGTQQCV